MGKILPDHKIESIVSIKAKEENKVLPRLTTWMLNTSAGEKNEKH